MARKRTKTYLKCKDNSGVFTLETTVPLTAGKRYEVLSMGFFMVKVIDDSGAEEWYGLSRFETVDKTITAWN